MFAAGADIKHHRETPPPCGQSWEVHPRDADDGRHDDTMMLRPLILLATNPQ